MFIDCFRNGVQEVSAMDEFRRGNMRSNFGTIQPRSRSERVGPRSRSARMRSSGGGRGRRGQKASWRRFFNWKWVSLVFLTTLLLVVGGCSAVMMSAEMYDLGSIEQENMPLTSKVLDKDENIVIEFGQEHREYVKIDAIKKVNPMLVDAFVKVEDRRFYEHIGIDFEGLARAVVKNIISLGKAQGASTITQQVCKNIVLKNPEKTYTRKIQEMGCALNLEREYSKDQILEAYLNYINFGGDIAGVQMASKVYFDKDVTRDKLTPQEVATLAGMPKAPNRYNPLKRPDQAIKRRNVVLVEVMPVDDVMKPMISEEEAKRLAKEPLETCKDCREKYIKKSKFDAYKAMVLEELKARYPEVNTEELGIGGYKIYTGLDKKAQEAVEEVLANDEYFTHKGKKMGEEYEAGVTMLDPQTGLIMAIGGGRDYDPGDRNRALEKISPGSTIKPLTVYAPAVQDHDYNEYTIVDDSTIQIGEWSPKNYSGVPQGEVPMMEMVKNSLNLSTVRILKDVVTLEKAYNYAEKLGLPLEPTDKGYAPLALGGMSKGVNTRDMAQAYAVFPNHGWYKPARTILKVEDSLGNELEPSDKEPADKQIEVFSKKTTYYMTRMLQEVVKSGTGMNAQLRDGRDVAGKTGTTQNGDFAWFVGYTPDVVCAVNVFYWKNPEDKVEITGGTVPAKIFSAIMSKALEGKPAKKFTKPEGVQDPVPPFRLGAPQLAGRFDGNAVHLSWNDQGERVSYKLLRSKDGGEFTVIREFGPGTTSFTDTDIEIPGSSGGFLENIFGGGSSKSITYRYKLIAIDTQATDPDSAKESNVVTITVGGEKSRDDDRDDDGQGGHPPGHNPNDPGDDRRGPGPHPPGGPGSGGPGGGGGGDDDGGGNRGGGGGGGFWPW